MQSTGVPEQLNAFIPEKKLILLHFKGLFTVMACPIPDCGLSGAIIIISPISFIEFNKEDNPLARYPSSLVNKIKGDFILLS